MAGIGSGVPMQQRAPLPGMPGGAPASHGMEEQGENPNVADPDDETPNVTPEMQEQYKTFVNNAIAMTSPPDKPGDIAPVIVQHLQGQFEPEAQAMLKDADPPLDPQSPTDSLAATTVLVVLSLQDSAEQAGKPVPPEVILHGGAEILGHLAEVSEAAKIHTFEGKDLQASIVRATDLYRAVAPNIDPEAAAEDFKQIQAADQAGQMDQLLPGFSKAGEVAGASGKPAMPAEQPQRA